MDALLLTPAQAGALLFGHCLVAKVAMLTDPKIPKKESEKITASEKYQVDHSTQLNEAEYAGPCAAACFFLATINPGASLAATLVAVGNVQYYWGRRIFGFPVYVPGALCRYVGMGLLTFAICKHVF
eukprot:g3492.t1